MCSVASGIVTGLKSLGKISFMSISSGSQKINVVATYDKTTGYDKLKTLKNNDYITIKIKEKRNEVLLIQIIEHIKNKGLIPEVENIKAYSVLLSQTRGYFSENGFLEVRLPSIHPGNNKGEIFPVNFFGEKARLSSSNALYSTIMAANMGKVYSIQRCFRAEPSKTYKHLSEFDMLEVSFVGHHFEELTSALSHFISEIFNRVQSAIPDQVKARPFNSIPIVSYDDLNRTFKLSNRGLSKYERQIAINGPIIVIHFPSKLSTWSARPIDDQHTYSFNFLAPNVGEVAEGCLRDTRAMLLRYKFTKLDLCNQLNWYVDLNPFPNVNIMSFGIGIERLAMWLFGLSNIRSLNCFYRDKKISETAKYGK